MKTINKAQMINNAIFKVDLRRKEVKIAIESGYSIEELKLMRKKRDDRYSLKRSIANNSEWTHLDRVQFLKIIKECKYNEFSPYGYFKRTMCRKGFEILLHDDGYMGTYDPILVKFLEKKFEK